MKCRNKVGSESDVVESGSSRVGSVHWKQAASVSRNMAHINLRVLFKVGLEPVMTCRSRHRDPVSPGFRMGLCGSHGHIPLQNDM